MTLLDTFKAYAALKIPESENNIAAAKRILAANSTITVGFFGTFSAGKSALIDALLGQKILPSKVLPTTSKITTISNSQRKFTRIFYATGLQTDIALANDKQSTDEQVSKKVLENIHDVNAVMRYSIHYPIPHMPMGVEFADTPGINSSEQAHSQETENFLQEADFVVYVLNGAQALQAVDLAFLRKISKDKFLFVIVNKVDAVDESEQSIDDIVVSVTEQLRNKGQIEKFAIYPLSANAVLRGEKDSSGNRFRDFQSKLSSLLNENLATIIQKKQERALAQFWPTLLQDYERDKIRHKQEKKQRSKKRTALLILATVLVGLGVGAYFSMDMYIAFQLKRLMSGAEVDRQFAIVSLARFPDKSLPLLKSILDSDKSREFEKLMALQTITTMGRRAQEILPSIVAFLKSERPDLLCEAMRSYAAMHSYDSVSINQIIKLIGHKDTAVSGQAIRTLREIHGQGTAFDTLILQAILKNLTKDPQQVGEILNYLGKLPHQRDVIGVYVFGLVKNGEDTYSSQAMDTLSNLGYNSGAWRAFLLKHASVPEDPLYSRARRYLQQNFPTEYETLRTIEAKRESALQNPDIAVEGASNDTESHLAGTQGKTVKPIGVSASSTLTEESGYVEKPEFAMDGNLRTTWADGNTSTDGIGEWLQFDFSGGPSISGIAILNGFAASHVKWGDLYFKNARPKEIELIVNGVTRETLHLKESRSLQYFRLRNYTQVRTVRLVIKDEYPGTKWKDTCIGEVVFFSAAEK